MTITHDDVQNIFKIIDSAEHLQEIDIEYGDFRVYVSRHREATDSIPSAPATKAVADAYTPAEPIRTPVPATAAHPKDVGNIVPEGMVTVRSPMLGIFYRAPSPGKKPFVDVGQQVKATDTVCLLEVMKLFNSVTAGVDGTIAQILVENGELVQYEQTIILIQPTKA